jgi:hypothetical protein
MALVTIPGGGVTLMPMPQAYVQTPDIAGNSTLQMNAASEKCGNVFRISQTGNVRHVSFVVDSVTIAPTAAHDIRLETVDATTGLSTGSLFGANTNGSATLDTTGFKTVTLTADAAVTVGDTVALVIAAPGANFGSITLGVFADDNATVPYTLDAPTAAAKGTLNLIMALEYDTGEVVYLPGVWTFSAITNQTYNSGSNPDRRGLRFSVPMPCRLSGCDLWADGDGDYNVLFYAADGTTATTVYVADKDVRDATLPGVQKIAFTTKQTLVADTFYRLVVLPTSVTNINTYRMDFSAAKYMDATPGGQDCHFTTANGAPAAEGDWTQTTTSRLFVSLRFDQLDDGTGDGGGGETAYVFS